MRPTFYNRNRAQLVALILLFAVATFGANRIFTKGATADFYPITCLGTWQNPQNAQNAPETLAGDLPLITEDNAAILKDSTGQIFCGGFVPGEFQEEGDLRSVALTLVWHVAASSTIPPTLEPSITPLSGEAATSSASSTVPVSTTTAPEAAETEPMFSWLGAVARAQEAQTIEPTNTGIDFEPTQTVASEPQATAGTENEQIVIEAPPLTAELEPVGTSTTESVATTTVEAPPTEVIIPTVQPDDNFLRVNYSLDGQSWFELQKVNVNNWPNFTVQVPVNSWEELRKVQISIEGIPSTLADLPEVSLDGMVLSATYDIPPLFGGEEEETPDVPDPDAPLVPVNETSSQRSFRADESPSFDLDLGDVPASTSIPATSSTESATSSAAGFFEKLSGFFGFGERAMAQDTRGMPALPTKNNPNVAEVLDPEGKPTELKPLFLAVGNQLRVSVPQPKSRLKPGRYHLRTWILHKGAIYYREQSFTWGVLAVNFNKSIYALNDPVRIGFGVLTDQGHTVCDAEIKATLVSPGGARREYSTENGSISKSEECGPVTVTIAPDYSAEAKANEPGVYKLNITALTENGTRELSDQFQVESQPEFDVERIGPTRIYPPATYEVRLKVRANKHFTGKITEFVPADFEITGAQSELAEEQRVISWQADMKPGDYAEFTYGFKAPDISPELYKLGPLTLGHWREARQWQIAADAVANNGRLFYGDATNLGILKFRTLANPFTFGNETSTGLTTTNSHIAHIVAKASPVRDEILVGHLKVDGRLDIARGINGSDTNTDYSAAWSNAGATGAQTCNSATEADCTRAFDISYEQLSGRGVVFYADTTNQKLYYCAWSGTAWGPVSNCAPTNGTNDITLSSNGRPVYVTAKAKPKSNEILVGVGVDVGGVYEVDAFVWNGNGTSTTSVTNITNTTNASAGGLDHGNSFEVDWESQTGDGLVVYATADTNSEIKYKRWTGGSWGSELGAIDTLTDGAVIHTMNMEADNRSNRIAFVANGSAGDINAAVWKPTSTAGWTNVSSQINETSLEGAGSDVGLYFVDLVWEFASSSPTSTAVVAALNAANNAVDFEYSLITCNDTSGCSASAIDANPATAGADDGTMVRLAASPNSRDVLALWTFIDRDLHAQQWSGTAWQGAASAALEATVSPGTLDNTPMHGLHAAFLYIPYKPWSMNWRWTSDFANNTPSSWLAAENTSTTASSTTNLRLRFNVAEKAGMGQTNSRKKLQFTTSATPDASSTVWTDVGNQGGSEMWTYANGPGTDDANIASNQLASSTASGPFVENGTAASAYDHTALAIAEYDFAIVSTSTASGQYYFRMYDNDQASPIYRLQPSGLNPCASNSVCKYPAVVIQAGNSAPTVSAVSLNNGNPIILTPGATTSISVSFTVTDPNGCTDVFTSGNVTTTVYRSGAGSSCTASDRSCYRLSSVTTHNCTSGSSANATSTVFIQYFADATDASSTYPSEDWVAHVAARDSGGLSSTATSTHRELNTLLAIDIVSSTVDYGTMSGGTDSGGTNQSIPVKNAGNSSSTLKVSGTALLLEGGFTTSTAGLTNTNSFITSGKRKVFWDSANSLYWMFYLSAGTTVTIANSPNGSAWTPRNTQTVADDTFSVWPVQNSTTVFMSYNGAGQGRVSKYILASSSATLTQTSPVNVTGAGGMVTVDSSGYVWLSGTIPSGSRMCSQAARSTNQGNLATFNTTKTFFCSTLANSSVDPVIILPLQSQDMLVVHKDGAAGASTTLRAIMWDESAGSTSSDAIQISDSSYIPTYNAVAGTSSDAHIIYTKRNTNSTEANFVTWSAGTFGTPVNLLTNATTSGNIHVTIGRRVSDMKLSTLIYDESTVTTEYQESSPPYSSWVDNGGPSYGFKLEMGYDEGPSSPLYGWNYNGWAIFGHVPPDGLDSIATSSQHYATSSFTYNGGFDQALSDIATTISGFVLTAPTSSNAVSKSTYWGIGIPGGKTTGSYLGTNTFTAVWSP